MTAQKLNKVQNYIEKRLQLWEPNIDKCLDLQIHKIEQIYRTWSTTRCRLIKRARSTRSLFSIAIIRSIAIAFFASITNKSVRVYEKDRKRQNIIYFIKLTLFLVAKVVA